MGKKRSIGVFAALTALSLLALAAFVVTQEPATPQAALTSARALLKEARETRALTTFGATKAFKESAAFLDALGQAQDPKARKTLFVAALLPLVALENDRIRAQRTRALTQPPGSPAYAALAHAYGLPPDTSRARLLRRIDIVPASLVVAQGAIESAWGTSRFARDGHAYFGMRSYAKDADGLKPRAADGFVVVRYPSPRHSVRAFLKTLNTHPAYRGFRIERARQRARGQPPSALPLAPFLESYSEIGAQYVKRVTLTVRANALERYEGLTLRAPSTQPQAKPQVQQ